MSPDPDEAAATAPAAGPEHDSRLNVEVHAGRPPTVGLDGEVDPHTAPLLHGALDGLIDDGAERIHVDCADLAFIDSSGLRVLVGAHRRLGGDKDALVLVAVSPTLRRLLEVTGLDAHLGVQPVGP